jgi:hypothetical protein
MEEEATMQTYWPDTPIHKRIMYLVLIKQNGRCQFCRKPFAGSELIVRSDTRAARYYHFGCAERRRINDKPMRVFSTIANQKNNTLIHK